MNIVAGNVFRSKEEPAIPAKYYLGLSTTAPDLDGQNVTEPATDAGYARVELTTLSAPTDGLVTNQQAVNFEESTNNWGTVTHFVIFDAAEANTGNLLMYGELTTPRTVETATIMTIKENYLKLSVQNPA
ncbi:hypothetical protein [Agathobaculum sp.]|uniref:phage tail fiber protein n=1 Tax=Agathobaculum sp. TaxID=2048138 RepID=UPI00351FD38C